MLFTNKSDCKTKLVQLKAGREEGVEVDQKALIEKILARYAGEFSVFRELMQNSDDASAKIVEIHFHTQAHLNRINIATQTSESSAPFPGLKSQPFFEWVFRHDGIPFADADWDRLRKIAEGNPDEEKIGAFGVGFYSLFSITDEPFVKSGNQWMGFYWKDDQLVARRGKLPLSIGLARSGSPWTSFSMPLREAALFPGSYLDFVRFLAMSLTFVRDLKDVSLYIDGHRVARIQKGVERAKQLAIQEYFDRTTPLRMMKVKEIHTNEFYLSARVMKWIHENKMEKDLVVNPQGQSTGLPASSSIESDPDDFQVSSIVLTIYTAQVSVRLEKEFSQELLRATKKKSPKITACSLIYIEKDDTSDEYNSVFRNLRADLAAKGNARIFIGHATSQSTGMGGHISARFIPTVERESVDLVDQNVSKWNRELLYVGGLLARFIYDMEISHVRDSWEEASKPVGPDGQIGEDITKQLETRGTRALQFFSFYPTTPSRVLGKELEGAFFSCARNKDLLVVSTAGVQSAYQVRSHNAVFKAFLSDLPMLPYNAALRESAIVNALRERGMLRDVSVQDVLDKLAQSPLREEEMLKCLEWRIGLEASGTFADKKLVLQRFVKETTFYLPNDRDEPVKLSSIKTFMSSINAIPRTYPLPRHTLPFSISVHFQPRTLRSVFGWDELGIADWIEHMVTPSTLCYLQENMTTSATYAEEVLNIITNSWATLGDGEKERLGKILKDKDVIPTTSGMMKPGKSYFPSVKLLDDLPNVRLPSGASIENNLSDLLSFLGVLDHVEIQVLINRMILTGNWDTRNLLDYIITNKTRLPQKEIENVGLETAFLQERSVEAPLSHSQKRARLSDLYQPLDVLRRLGLPLLDWGAHMWCPYSDEAKLLFKLGLRVYPELPKILELMASSEEEIRKLAMQYFVFNFTRYASTYDPRDFADLAYIPAVNQEGTHFMSKPGDVYVNPECSVMGFSVVNPQLQDTARSKLCIKEHPSTKSIIKVLLERPPKEPKTARQYFEYLASRISDFSLSDYRTLQQACILPVMLPVGKLSTHQAPYLRMVRPDECIFKSKEASENYAKLLMPVDFGSKANIFLKECGVKDRVKMMDIITLLLRDPNGFLELVGSTNEYLRHLRDIAAYKECPQDVLERMRSSPFLLGRLKVVQAPEGSESGVSSVDCRRDDAIFRLLQPSQIAVVNDIDAYSLFSDSVHVAPEEEAIEAFYLKLGSPELTTVITEECEACDIESSESSLATATRSLVLERSRLFLHEQSTRAKVKIEWLSQTDNFVVQCCENLRLHRLMSFQGKSASKIQMVSARTITANGRITLWLSKNGELDMYEVANSMCKVLLSDPRPNDSLIFSSILSTDLHALRRRGYNVDRILRKQPVAVSTGEPKYLLAVQRNGSERAQSWSESLLETGTTQQDVAMDSDLHSKLQDVNAPLPPTNK
ncbi:hypothetical protein FRC02_000579, partial [Tulasnella sp. 418]